MNDDELPQLGRPIQPENEARDAGDQEVSCTQRDEDDDEVHFLTIIQELATERFSHHALTSSDPRQFVRKV